MSNSTIGRSYQIGKMGCEWIRSRLDDSISGVPVARIEIWKDTIGHAIVASDEPDRKRHAGSHSRRRPGPFERFRFCRRNHRCIGALNNIAAHRINAKLIAEHWDDLLRLAGSLKLGVVQAISIMRTLQISDRPTRLPQAVAELARIDKTLHALNYIDDETKRRRILQQLNKGEDRHKLARAVFHGKRGELRQRYREGQEDQLGALGLVVNVIVLWNTIYINAALQQLEQEGFEIQSEDITRLSPLVFEHINLLGRYAFSLPEAVSRGELRPLRNASDLFGEIASWLVWRFAATW